MKISNNGVALIKKFEGYKNKPYICTAGRLTIGYGHVIKDDEVYLKDNTITYLEANKLLYKDLEKFEVYLNDVCSKYKIILTQNQFDALMSFCFNTGFFSNNMINRFKNQDIKSIGESLILYNKAAGRELEGLKKRRLIEQQLFFS